MDDKPVYNLYSPDLSTSVNPTTAETSAAAGGSQTNASTCAALTPSGVTTTQELRPSQGNKKPVIVIGAYTFEQPDASCIFNGFAEPSPRRHRNGTVTELTADQKTQIRALRSKWEEFVEKQMPSISAEITSLVLASFHDEQQSLLKLTGEERWGRYGYTATWSNFASSVSVALKPKVESAFKAFLNTEPHSHFPRYKIVKCHGNDFNNALQKADNESHRNTKPYNYDQHQDPPAQ